MSTLVNIKNYPCGLLRLRAYDDLALNGPYTEEWVFLPWLAAKLRYRRAIKWLSQIA